MSAESIRLILLIVSGCFVVCDLYLFVLWIYGVIRTRLGFLWILVLAGLLHLLLAAINLALIYAPEQVRAAIGPQYPTLYVVFLLVQPFSLFLGLIGYTMLVSWVVRAERRKRDRD